MVTEERKVVRFGHKLRDWRLRKRYSQLDVANFLWEFLGDNHWNMSSPRSLQVALSIIERTLGTPKIYQELVDILHMLVEDDVDIIKSTPSGPHQITKPAKRGTYVKRGKYSRKTMLEKGDGVITGMTLREWRVRSGLNQRELARRLYALSDDHFGHVSPMSLRSTISFFEIGSHKSLNKALMNAIKSMINNTNHADVQKVQRTADYDVVTDKVMSSVFQRLDQKETELRTSLTEKKASIEELQKETVQMEDELWQLQTMKANILKAVRYIGEK